ncbi:hypothetical protein FSARC_11103 [Fusarium sarcochroum]|uniref:Heterokaryon incompatibility domain-containing protein n=1 Tax=Fusarium sarcochroum TaxID=1208366 RepID=A0A8H4X1R7_9HYPO|nr:hypothetical protein FSARC_11103 [Fusarium sarcochroum]
MSEGSSDESSELLAHGNWEPDGNPNNGQMFGEIYESLDNSRQEIRLLILHPPSGNDPIVSCTLSHAALEPGIDSAVPTYEALSYVWGEPDFSSPILLNGKSFFVTPSLHYILSSIRLQRRTRVLWVDALCINQSDPEERIQQVALMRKIYSCCERDIAWLDPMIGKGVKSRDIYRDLEKLADKEERIRKGIEFMQKIIQKDSETLKTLQDFYRESDFFVKNSDQLLMRDLFRRPTLWKRLWVMQELSLAPQVTLMCNGAELDWSSLAAFFKDEPYFDAFHTLRSHAPFYYLHFNDIFIPAKLIEDQRRLSSGATGERSSRLIDVLARFRAMESTDPRDKIYGLLGLVTENHGIRVDYSKSLSKAYEEVTLSLINLSGDLDVLCQSLFERKGGPQALHQVDSAESQGDKLPSWTVEFDLKPRDCVSVLFAQRNIFNAGAKHCETPCRLVGPAKTILALKGSFLGCVGPILQVEERHNRVEDIMELYLGEDAFQRSQSQLYAPKIGSGHIPTSETAFQAFWRTLVIDCIAPPRMRRLRKAEIEALDVENRRWVSERHINILTYRINNYEHYSRSAFSYDLGENFDFTEVDKAIHRVSTGTASVGHAIDDFIFATTENGLFLLTRPHVQQGDVVAVLEGGKVPLVLRKTKSRDDQGGLETYNIVCSTYVHGFMDGEAETGVAEGWLKKQDILIA